MNLRKALKRTDLGTDLKSLEDNKYFNKLLLKYLRNDKLLKEISSIMEEIMNEGTEGSYIKEDDPIQKVADARIKALTETFIEQFV